MPETENYQPSKTTLYLNDLQTTLFFELGTDEDTVGGPMLMPMCYTVNFFKGFTFVWVVALMLYFQNYSKAMILYLCLHGTYGFCWVIKDFVFPDARAQKMGTVCSHVLLFTLLVAVDVVCDSLVSERKTNEVLSLLDLLFGVTT